MAQALFASDNDPFSCSICLERFTDPVTIPCGHSYCKSCLKDYWDRQRGACCPQCRAAFSPRPKLGRNVVLLDMMQKLEAVSLNRAPSAPPMHEVLGFDHASFDVSSERPGRNQVQFQKVLEETRRLIAAQIKEKDLEIKLLQNTIQSFSLQASAAARDSDQIFTELLDFLQHRRVEVTELIVAQQEAEVTRAESHLQLLTRHMSALKRRSAELKKLSHVQDPKLITEMCRSLRSPPVAPDASGSWTFSPHVSFGPVRKAIADLKEQIQSLYHSVFPTVTSAVKDVKLRKIKKASKAEACGPASVPTPDRRDDLIQYFSEPSFDPFTAHKEISLTERNRAACRKGEIQPRPDHPDRFDSWCQALGSEGLQGRCYYEVVWDGVVCLGLTYESIGRKGSSDSCKLGHSDASWMLHCSATCLSFLHRKRAVQVSAGGPRHHRIGVLLDHGAGVLCFYAVNPSELRLLHREAARFEQPLFPAVWLGSRSVVSFCTVDSL